MDKNLTLFYPKNQFKLYSTIFHHFAVYNTGDKMSQSFNSHYYDNEIPDKDEPLSASSIITKPKLKDFELKVSGKIKYYNALFYDPFMPIPGSHPAVYVNVVASPDINVCNFPNLPIAGLNLNYIKEFKLQSLDLADYNCDDISYFDFNRANFKVEKFISKSVSTQYRKYNSIITRNFLKYTMIS